MHPLYITGIPRIIIALLIGFILGFVLLRSKLALRKTLVDQFCFKDNTFAITVLVSMVIGVPLFYFFAKYNLIRLDFNNYQFWAVVVGAIVTGLGVSFCGHIPMTAIASLGSGKIYSLWIFLGMLAAFPVLKLIKPIVNDYVFGKKAPMDVNVLAQNSVFYDGKTTMLYTIPAVCLILALFLRLIQPKGK
ncbi:MAG: YeeE/YedE family protein [Victivallales bacterium]|nr:YeeE/YedE family protein [Victivallales bacterium]MCF7889031.1 YeeE/YedE family protein [Victivallales bacterium]